ncbi:class I SAM-dependent methyltransferase [Edaphocola aurantiacus]|uniref:class I SAM-dependent methyltransferase n=1 Tax=Edaphocola aurantiacus TaxID=2601682 RepID=UPI001C98D43F|nr:class I SAM-dependent methyltransferase [Edaphocola aurantiacus]
MENIYDPAYVKTLFNKMSGSYERMNYITSFGFSIRWRRQHLRQLGTSSKELKVLDLLSGLGENWSILKQQFPNAQFYSLDFSDEMVRNAMPKAQRIFKDKLNIVCEDVLENSYAENTFDIISCAYGLKTFTDEQLDQLAKQLKRILKVNGKFSFIEVSKPAHKPLLFFYRLYLARIIPVLGKLFLGNPSDYKMLWVYTAKFENSEKVKQIFERNGLSVQFQQYFFGCATGVNGTKL